MWDMEMLGVGGIGRDGDGFVVPPRGVSIFGGQCVVIFCVDGRVVNVSLHVPVEGTMGFVMEEDSDEETCCGMLCIRMPMVRNRIMFKELGRRNIKV